MPRWLTEANLWTKCLGSMWTIHCGPIYAFFANRQKRGHSVFLLNNTLYAVSGVSESKRTTLMYQSKYAVIYHLVSNNQWVLSPELVNSPFLHKKPFK